MASQLRPLRGLLTLAVGLTHLGETGFPGAMVPPSKGGDIDELQARFLDRGVLDDGCGVSAWGARSGALEPSGHLVDPGRRQVDHGG